MNDELASAPPPLITHHSSLITFCIPVMAGIGNALMAQPMVRQLGAAFPEASIHVVSRLRPMLDVFDGLPRVAGLHQVSIKPKAWPATLRTFRAIGADVCVVPYPSNRWQYPLMARAARAKTIVTHRYPVGRFTALGFLGGVKVDPDPAAHDVANNNALLRPLGIEPDDTIAPRWDVTDEQDAAGARLLGDLADARPTIVHAGCGDTVLARAKRWPPAKFAKLIEALDGPVVLFEGPDEAGVADEILTHTDARPAVVRVIGPLGDTAGLLRRCGRYVGTDSGIAHLAAAVDTPPVTLFGPADPDRVAPFGHRHRVVQPRAGRFPHAPYPLASTKPHPGDPTAIQTIEVEDILEKLKACPL
ncbi:MAG: glycosyltransferase family 9 protein [Planctomycetota bacterium]